MKNPFILLPIFIDSCGSSGGGVLNPGSSSECLEGLTTRLFLAKGTFRFADIDAFKDKTVFEQAIQNKDIVPLYDVYEVASDNKEAVKYESGNFSYVTEKEVKRMTAESYLSVCSHSALKSYENSEYTQVFEITSKGEILGVYDDDGIKIKGQDITAFEVAIRERPTKDKPAFSKITVTYRDFEEFDRKGVIVKEAWDIAKLMGIFEVSLYVVSASSTEIVVRAATGCGKEPFSGFVLADWGGTVGTVTAQTESNGVYTLTGTFASGVLSTSVATVNSLYYQASGVNVTI